MKRNIIAYENYYRDFFDTLSKGAQEKSIIWLTHAEERRQADSEIDKALKLKK